MFVIVHTNVLSVEDDGTKHQYISLERHMAFPLHGGVLPSFRVLFFTRRLYRGGSLSVVTLLTNSFPFLLSPASVSLLTDFEDGRDYLDWEVMVEGGTIHDSRLMFHIAMSVFGDRDALPTISLNRLHPFILVTRLVSTGSGSNSMTTMGARRQRRIFPRLPRNKDGLTKRQSIRC